jgi:hypothetical protein
MSWLFVILLVMPNVLAAEDRKDANELNAYLEQIRDWGMTEVARMHLRMIASTIAGGTLLSFYKDGESGAYYTRYTSAFCPSPEMSDIERQRVQKEQEAKVLPLINKLQPIADMDDSGFVTTEEGAEFREIVEFGYRAAHVLNEEGHDMEQISAGLSMNEEQVRERAKKYQKFLAKAGVVGIGLPDLDL